MNKHIFPLTALTAMALVLPGCTSTYRAQAVSISERLCNVDSLRTERDQNIREARGLADMGLSLIDLNDVGAVGVDAFGERSERQGEIRVENAPFGPGSEITRLVRAFEIDLDASYQFASSSCQAYSMCMQMNASIEGRCENSRQAWQDAQVRFSETSSTLGEIRSAISVIHVENQRRVVTVAPTHPPIHRPHNPHRPHHHHPHSHEDESCRQTLAQVLTADPCK